MKPLILLAIAPWMIFAGGDEPWRNPPWHYRMEMPAPPSLFMWYEDMPLVRPRNWGPRLCCPHKPTV